MRELPLGDHSWLREDGSVFPPVTPDVPAPPGYASPLDDVPALDAPVALPDVKRGSGVRTPDRD